MSIFGFHRSKTRPFLSIPLLLAFLLLAAPAARAATLTVCASGCGFTTIPAALSAAASGDTIEILDAVHTAAGIVVDKSVTLKGQGAQNTIVQAAATPGTATDRVFDVNDFNGGDLDVTFQDMTIRHGYTTGDGGGILGRFNGNDRLTVLGCAVSQNTADSVGGGINIEGGNLLITDSTLDGNSANLYGGLSVTALATADLYNVTVSGNSGRIGGIGLDRRVTMTLTNVTISGNSSPAQGGGLFLNQDATTTVSNTIVAGNTGGDCFLSSPLTIPPGAPNLDSDGTCTGFSLQNANADLGPLVNNGGPTETHAIGLASDALDAGDDAICAASPVDGLDQRGVTRPQGAHCDLGAFELVQNQAPDCSEAEADPDDIILPLIITFVPVQVDGVTDPDGDPVTITITSIFQDEPIGLLHPDGYVSGSTAYVRAEANLFGNGRVYHIGFTASDGQGGTCNGTVKTGARLLFPAVDNGATYNSTL